VEGVFSVSPGAAVTNQVSSGISPTPTYDANGNQKTCTATSLTWNALNQPVTVNGINATYDALGRMVETGSGSTYQQFVFRPYGDLLAVYSSGLVKGTVPLPGGDTAIYNASGLNYIRHTDWLGSSRLATTWAHAVYSKEAYAPYGETYDEAGTADRSYTGEDQDVVTGSAGSGVYDFLYRKHDPSSGRWLSPDPSGWNAVDLTNPQSLNRYEYAANAPLRYIDPSGLDWCTAMDGGGWTCNDQWGNPYTINADGYYLSSITVDDNDDNDCADTDSASCLSDYSLTSTIAMQAPSNGIIQKLQNFQNACGNKYQGAIAVSDTLGYVGLAGSALNGVASLTNSFSGTLTSNATQLAGQIGESSGMSAAEVLATHAGGGAVSIAQDVSLAGRITGQIGGVIGVFGKVSGAVSLAATATSLGIRAGCAAGWW